MGKDFNFIEGIFHDVYCIFDGCNRHFDWDYRPSILRLLPTTNDQ